MSEPIFTLANQLTLLRMAMAPLLVVLVLSGEHRWAFGVFLVAGVTDLLDGWVARLSHQETRLGAMLDPVADKLLVGSMFVVLTWGSEGLVTIPKWVTVTILSRDGILVVAVLIINLAIGRRLFYPTIFGKLTTFAQLIAGGYVLLANAFGLAAPGLDALFVVVVAMTLGSAAHYAYLGSQQDRESYPD